MTRTQFNLLEGDGPKVILMRRHTKGCCPTPQPTHTRA